MSNKNNYTRKTSYNAPRTVKKQNKTFTYWLVVVALAWVFISSFFGTYAFIKTVTAEEPSVECSLELSNDNSISLYDSSTTSYNFTSSSIFISSSRYMVSSQITNGYIMSSQNYISNFRFNLISFNGDILFIPSIYCQGVVNPPSLIINEQIYDYNTSTVTVPHLRSSNKITTQTYEGQTAYKLNALTKIDSDYTLANGSVLDLSDFSNFSNYTGLAFRIEHSTLSGQFQFFCGIGYETGMIPNFRSVRIYTKKVWDNSTLTAIYFNVLDYRDINNKIFRIVVPMSCSSSAKLSAYGFTDRTYYYSSSFSDNVYYEEGYQQGKQEGQSIGNEQGRQEGYNDGFREGEIKGYNKGVEVGSDYTFLRLLTAVVDAPLTALGGLLNFDLLGFNMLNFFYAIITTALIIFIVRLVMGK